MSVRGRSSLVGLGSVAAPVVIFLVLKATIGLGPAASSAQSPEADSGPAFPADAPGGPRSAEQSRALAWLADLRIDADLPSPLERSEPVVPTPPPVVPAPIDPLAGLRISALLAGTDGGSALISGRVYRPGDAVVAGYTIHTIDVRGGRVELTGPDGQTRWLERKP